MKNNTMTAEPRKKKLANLKIRKSNLLTTQP